MRLGIQIARFESPGGPDLIGPAFAEIATRADAAGFESLWVMDHFFQLPQIGPVESNMLDGYTALAFAAGITKRIKLGTLVTGVTYRHPGVLVKQVTSLDVLSGGRAYFGIGAAWYEREHLGLGIPYPPLAERFARLEETLQIAQRMWAGDASPYQGTCYQLAEPINQPPALSRPHPPILIGGSGEQKTLRLVARYADACNLFAFDVGEVKHKLNVLRRHCEAEGRDYDAIEKTVLGPAVAQPGIIPEGSPAAAFTVGPTQAVDLMGQFRELGIEHFIFGGTIEYPEMIDLIVSEVMPHVAKQPVTA